MPSRPPGAKPAEITTRAADQLGGALARFRALSHLSQAQVAASAGLRQATVSKAEQGIPTTQLETIYALCAALALELVVRPREGGRAPARLEDFIPQ